MDYDEKFVNSQTSDGQTPLMFAAKAGSTDNLWVLLEKGKADVDITDDYGKTALSYAHNTDGIQLMIKYGAELTPKVDETPKGIRVSY